MGGVLELHKRQTSLGSVPEAIIATYVVVNALVQYVFDAAAIETALEQPPSFIQSACHGRGQCSPCAPERDINLPLNEREN